MFEIARGLKNSLSKIAALDKVSADELVPETNDKDKFLPPMSPSPEIAPSPAITPSPRTPLPIPQILDTAETGAAITPDIQNSYRMPADGVPGSIFGTPSYKLGDYVPAPPLPEIERGQGEGISTQMPGSAPVTRQQRIANLQELLGDPTDERPENKPARWKAAIGLALNNISEAMARGASLEQALGAGLGAGAAGAFTPRVFADARHRFQLQQLLGEENSESERRKRDLQLEGLEADIDYRRQRPEIEDAKIKARQRESELRFEAKMKSLEAQAQREGGKWKPYIDAEGKIWKQFQNDPARNLEPVLDAEGKQEVKPSQAEIETYSPITGKRVSLTSKDLFSGEANIAAGNAQRVQSADAANVNNDQEYEAQVRKIDEDRIRLTNESVAETNQAYELERQAAQFEQQAQSAPDDAARLSLTRQASDLRIRASQMRNSGASKLNQAQNVKYPERPKKIQGQTVKVGRVSEDVFRQRLEKQGIKVAAQQKQIIEKARADGVVF
jgi:hypothetical protein